MKKVKSIMAVFLTIVLLVSNVFEFIPEKIYAKELEQPQIAEATSSFNSENITIGGTNSVGKMIGSVFESKQAEQQENQGCNIFSVEMKDNIATVSLETFFDGTLVVGVYEEDGIKMLASGTTVVSAGTTEATVTVEISTMPKYFYLRALFVDSNTLEPLCTAYTSPEYTKEMQDFLSKTTDDFSDEKVLNLDEDKTNNFAVYSEKTKVIWESSAANQLVASNEETQTYTFENADESITSLQAGDILAYHQGVDNVLITKITDIDVNNTTVTIRGEDSGIEEAFEYVKIDASSDASKATVDTSTCSEGVEFNGIISDAENEEVETNSVYDGDILEEITAEVPQINGVDISESTSGKLSYTIKKKEYKTKDGDYVKAQANLEYENKASVRLYITNSYQYIETKFDYSFGITGELAARGALEFKLGTVGFSPVPGLLIELTPMLTLEATGKIKLNGTLYGRIGVKASSDEELVNLSTTPTFKAELGIEATLFIGLSLEPKIAVINDNVGNIGIEARVGGEITGSFVPFSTSSATLHKCNVCIDGDIYAKSSLSFKTDILFGTLKYERKFYEKKIKLFDFYWCRDHDKFELTTCPDYAYKVSIAVKDKNGEALKDVKIKTLSIPFTIKQENKKIVDVNEIITDKDGKTIGYLPNGIYTLSITKDDYQTVTKQITIKDAVKELVIELEENSSDDGDSDGKEDDDSGKGDNDSGKGDDNSGEGDDDSGKDDDSKGEGEEKEDNVVRKSCNTLSLGFEHSGVITEDGSLYMWGDSYYGQMGEIPYISGDHSGSHVPIKVMDNVVAVSLGDNHSGAISEDGSLYMWGSNLCGKLGTGTWSTSSAIPTKVMDNVVAVSLGDNHSGAITADGSLYMWGYNGNGQLGNGTTEESRVPIKVMDNVVAVSLGEQHSGAITADGSLYMWGYNEHGQLGNGTTEDSHVPIKVMDNVVAVSLGFDNSGAITENGNLYMWGDYYSDEAEFSAEKLVPNKVMDDVVLLSLGGGHTGVIKKDGSLYMWGSNDDGQLGNGTTEYSSIPIKVMDDVVALCLNWSRSGAITKDGSLYMWGNNRFGWKQWGQLGNGTKEGSTIPIKILDNVKVPTKTVKESSINAAEEPEILTLSTDNVSLMEKMETDGNKITYSNLDKNTLYNIYAFKSKNSENLLSSENLLYVNQVISDQQGNVTLPYGLKEAYDSPEFVIKKNEREDISKASVTVSDLCCTGTERTIAPVVVYQGETLVLGVDYELEGELSAKELGEYTFTINGINNYSGTLSKKYKIKEHAYTAQLTESPTCEKEGKEILTCADCGETVTKTLKALGHKEGNWIVDKAATSSSAGNKHKECTLCKKVLVKETIPKVAKITLSSDTYIYNGKAKTPKIILKDSNRADISTDFYTVNYPKERKNVGKYTITIVFKGDYQGTVKKTFTINPKGVNLSKVTSSTKGFTANWKKNTKQVTGYQLQYSLSSKFASGKKNETKIVNIKTNKVTSKKIRKLKSGKKYYVRIRTYKKSGKINYYSKWSKAKKVTVK